MERTDGDLDPGTVPGALPSLSVSPPSDPPLAISPSPSLSGSSSFDLQSLVARFMAAPLPGKVPGTSAGVSHADLLVAVLQQQTDVGRSWDAVLCMIAG